MDPERRRGLEKPCHQIRGRLRARPSSVGSTGKRKTVALRQLNQMVPICLLRPPWSSRSEVWSQVCYSEMDFLLFQKKIIWLHDYITAKLWTLITKGICLLSAVCVLSKALFFFSTVGESCALLLLGTKWSLSVVSISVKRFTFICCCQQLQIDPIYVLFKADDDFLFRKMFFILHRPFLERWNDCSFTFTCLE